jgi:hypothetical protein
MCDLGTELETESTLLTFSLGNLLPYRILS